MNIAYSEALQVPTVFPRRKAWALNRLETRNWDFIAATAHCSDYRQLEQLREELRVMFGAAHIFFAPSARCAIARVLSSLPGDEVVVPAWTCGVVRRAIEVAGKRIVYVDIDRNSVNAGVAQYARAAQRGRILLPTHLFGIPTEIGEIAQLGRERGCMTLEDAAGAFPSQLGGRLLGSFGDFGVISFERSKRVPSFRGAAIIVNNEEIADIAKLKERVAEKGSFPIREFLRAIAHNVGTIPWFYGRYMVPHMLRAYAKSSLIAATDSSITADPSYTQEFQPYQAALVRRILRRRDNIRTSISRLVAIYTGALRGTSIQTFTSRLTDPAGLLRFPIAFLGTRRTEILRAALRRGIFLETNYEKPLPSVARESEFPNSFWAARNVILLPLYKALSEKGAAHIVSEIIDIERRAARNVARELPEEICA